MFSLNIPFSLSSNRGNTLKNTSIHEMSSLLLGRKISSVEVIKSFLDELEKSRHLNIFITECRELAIQQAEDSDRRIMEGTARPLEGIPFAIKDNFCTNKIRTTAGSKMLENFIPAYESTITQKLFDAGAIMLGKTNMDEFAMGSSTETSFFNPTINPVGVDLGFNNLVPGGSSGGSAAAVAGGLAVAALGTDTGGSIRQPASYCGLVGFKPTYGVCSRYGIAAYASSLDQAGVLTKSVNDAAIIMDVIAGGDPRDSTSIPKENYSFVKTLESPTPKLKIGFPKEVRQLESTSDVSKIWQLAESLSKRMGAEIVEVSLPHIMYALPAYYIIALSEASSNLARYDGIRFGYRTSNPENIQDLYNRTRAEGFGEEVQRRILLGTFSLSSGYYDAYYLRAQKVRNLIAGEFKSAFEKVDIMFMPTTPTSAFEIGEHSDDPVKMYLEDIFTVPVNLAGLPAISLPIAKSSNGMPLGLQLIGAPSKDEDLLLAAARAELEIAMIS